MYYEETFVLISPTLEERFLTASELRHFLQELLVTMAENDLPQDLRQLSTMEQRLDRLMNTACDLDCGGVWQWYAVRLHKS
jgi:hypothetical protein